MKERTLSILAAQEQLMDIAEKLEQEPEIIIVTQNDESVMVILSYDFERELQEKLKALREELFLLEAQKIVRRKIMLLEEFDEE